MQFVTHLLLQEGLSCRFDELPMGEAVFIDANIFVYRFTSDAFEAHNHRSI